MFSNFKITNEKKIENYVKRLISLLTGKEELNEEFEMFFKYAISTVRNHKFLDADKFKTIRELKGICEKFVIHSQEEKATRLDNLMKQLLQKKFKNQVLDIHYVIISLFLLISRNPLENKHLIKKALKSSPEKKKPPEEKTKILREENNEIQKILEEWGPFEKSSSESEEESEINRNYGLKENEKSALSIKDLQSKSLNSGLSIPSMKPAFISDIFCGNINRKEPTMNHDISGLGKNENLDIVFPSEGFPNEKPEKNKKRNFQDFFAENFMEKTVIMDEKFDKDREELERTIKKSDVLNNPMILAETYKNFILEKDRYSGTKKDVLELNHWIYETKDERIILEEVFQMLLNQETPIFGLKNDSKFEFLTFEIRLKCEVSHLTPLALESLLEDFVGMANSVQEIDFLIRDLRAIMKARVFEAFLNKCEDKKTEFLENVSNYQLIFFFHSYKLKRKEIKKALKEEFLSKIATPMTLLHLKTILNEEAERSIFFLLKVLKKIKAGIYRIKFHYMGENINAIITAEIIDYLYNLLDEEFVEKNTPYFKLIIELFVEAFQIYYSFITDWVNEGVFSDFQGEFMIQQNRKNDFGIQERIDWFRDFEIRKLNEIPIIPGILSRYYLEILKIGKSVKLLTQLGLTIDSDKLNEDVISSYFSKALSLIRPKNSEIKALKERIRPLENNYKTFYEDKIMKEITNEKTEEEDEGKKEDFSPIHEFYQPKPEIQKFKIEAFNLNSLTKKSRLSLSHLSEGKIEERQLSSKKKPQKKEEDSLSKFKISFDQCLKSAFLSYKAKAEKILSEQIFDKMYLMEYFHCLRTFFFLENAHLFQNFLGELFKKVDNFGSVNNIYGLNSILKEILKDLKKKKFIHLNQDFSIEIETNSILTFKFFEMNNLNLIFKAPYPLNFIFDEDSIALYNILFRFLLKIKRAKFNTTNRNYVIKKFQKKDVKFHKNSFDLSFDEDELNYSGNSSFFKNIEENNLNIKKINFLKHKLSILQKHLLNFINTFEHFVMDNIISQNSKAFINNIGQHRGLEEIISQHKKFLEKILNECYLRGKTEKVVETINAFFEIANKFNKLLLQLETLNIHSDSILSELFNMHSECQNLTSIFHKTNKILFSLIRSEGNQTSISLLNKLDFSNFYFSEAGKYVV